MIDKIDNNFFVKCACGTVVDNFFWGMHISDNILYRIDLQTGKIEDVCVFSKLHNLKNAMDRMFAYKETLIILPGRADYVITYSIKSGKTVYHPYKSNQEHFVKYSSIVYFNNCAYAFPFYENKILKINLESWEIDYIPEPVLAASQKAVLGKTYIQSNNKLLIPCKDNNYVLCWDLLTETYEWIYINIPSSEGISSIAMGGKNIFLIDMQNNLYIWDYEKNECVWVWKSPYESMGIYGNEKGVWIIPRYYNNIFRYDALEKQSYETEYPKETYYTMKSTPKLPCFKEVVQREHISIIVPRFINMLIVMDNRKAEINFIKLYADDDIYAKNFISESAYMENAADTLKDFNSLVLKNSFRHSEKKEEFIGKKIYYSN